MQNVKGVFVNACGIYSAPSADRMLARISVQKYHTDDGRSLQQGL